MDLDFEKEHEILFSGTSFTLGKVQWYLSRADFLIEEASKIPNTERGIRAFRPVSSTLTDFGEEAYGEEIHWWVFQQELDHPELLRRTEITYEAVQRLEKKAEYLLSFESGSYEGLIKKLNNFCEENSSEIQCLFDYTEWLAGKDPRAPVILYSFEGGWSCTQLSHRMRNVDYEKSPEYLLKMQKICTEYALGLRDNMGFRREQIFSDMCADQADNFDGEYPTSIRIDNKVLNIRTSHAVIIEFFTFIKNVRDCIRKIILEIDSFNKEPFVIRTIIVNPTNQRKVRFGIVQLKYSLQPVSGGFGCEPKDEMQIKSEVISAIKVAQEKNVDVLTFPELCFKKDWIEEILPLSENLIIIGGSYYDKSANICPVIINGHQIQPEYAKVNPSSFERIEIQGQRMVPGKFIYLYQTSCGFFTVLTCIDFEQVIHSIISAREKIDFIVNPCYDEQIVRFQRLANTICENNEITIIQVNRSEDSSGKFGHSGILSREHDTIIARLTMQKMRDDQDPKYLLAKTNDEELLIADINFELKSPPLPLPGDYQGRINKVQKIPL
jgi:predicted amidohydrolase